MRIRNKGTGQALTDVMTGQVQMMMSSALPAVPHIKAGRLRGSCGHQLQARGCLS
jgi:tripartite-type tricarboxylate transporter receptor subunit TctC